MELFDDIDKRSAYGVAHVIKALLLASEKPLGREQLAKELQLHVATSRTLLNYLVKKKLFAITPDGHVPTARCMRLVAHIRKHILGPRPVKKTAITLGMVNVAYLVKKRSRRIGNGMEQRDQAILMGATGLTTVVRNGRLRAPGYLRVPKEIEALFDAKKGDVILIGSAESRNKADLASLYTAYSLLS